LNAKSGDKNWEFITDGQKANNGVFDDKGNIKKGAFGSAADKNNTWKPYMEFMVNLMSGGGVLSSPFIENGVIYFGSADGYMYAIK